MVTPWAVRVLPPRPSPIAWGSFSVQSAGEGGEKPKPKLPLLCVPVGIFASVSGGLTLEVVAPSVSRRDAGICGALKMLQQCKSRTAVSFCSQALKRILA